LVGKSEGKKPLKNSGEDGLVISVLGGNILILKSNIIICYVLNKCHLVLLVAAAASKICYRFSKHGKIFRQFELKLILLGNDWLYTHTHTHTHIYIYIYTHTHIYIYIYNLCP
jgi:hypothetical protein